MLQRHLESSSELPALHPSRRHRRRRVRRVERGAGTAASAGRSHAHRPPQLSSVSAAAVPGGDRRPVAREYRRAAAVDRRAAGELRSAAGRSARLRRRRTAACSLDGMAIAVRHADRRRRRAVQLLRPSRMGAFAPGLKTIEDATEIRRRLLTAFELAEREADPERRRMLLTFVIVGGGPTGVEMAGAMAEIARHSSKHEFRHIDPADAQIMLVEAGDRVLGAYPPELSAKAQQSLERLGVIVRTKTMVTDVAADHVARELGRRQRTACQRKRSSGRPASRRRRWRRRLADGDRGAARSRRPDRRRARPVAARPSRNLRARRHGQLLAPDGKPLPGVAPVAIQQGRYVAKLIAAAFATARCRTFHYRDLGNMATIGRSAAVADFGKLHFSGFVAWMMWLVDPPDEPGGLPQPPAGARAMGLELFHVRPLGPADHRRPNAEVSTTRSDVRVMSGQTSAARPSRQTRLTLSVWTVATICRVAIAVDRDVPSQTSWQLIAGDFHDQANSSYVS